MMAKKHMNIIMYVLYALLPMWCAFSSYAQQEPMYTQNNFDRLVFNPAYAGSSGWIVTSLKHRSQFIGIDGAPSTQMVTIHAPWQIKSMGFGGKIINDHLGATGQFNATAIYAYHLGLGKGKLSVGIEGGIFSQTIDFSTLYKIDPIDKAIPTGKSSVIKPDASFGLQFQARDYFVGFSIVHLFSDNLNFTNTDRSIVGQLNKHYFLSGGYVYDLKNEISVQPCFLLKKVAGAPMQVDLYTNVIYKDKYTLGIGYRTGDALTFVAKVNITDAIRVSYSYDFRISSVANYSSSAQEFMIRYGIKLLPPQQIKEINPRYYF